jgi:glycosyltransferase involved in cell wall biosynthesis
LGYVVPYGDVTALELVLSQIASRTEEEREIFTRHAQQVYSMYFSAEHMHSKLLKLLKSVLDSI